jgi:cytochrome c oxidase subunit 4
MADSIQHLDARHQTSDPHAGEAVRTYYIIFIWLMVLLALTVIASRFDLDHLFPGLNLLVAMAIAIAKALLVVLFFMHVKKSSKLTWIFASAALLWLGMMFTYSFTDYLSRTQFPEAVISAPNQGRIPALEHVNRGAERYVPRG